jgi:asparagine synthase (glutamine-hydrolysing)
MVGLNGQPGCRASLKRMAQVSVHRGPDDEGEFVEGALAMGMRRLSIIDLSGGHQPICNEDRSIWVVCNGEIYNFRAIRESLQSQGHVFATGSDTEVIVHLYEQHGSRFVEHLDGMFGFALWDSRRQRLFIGRDRLGIKPLYISREGGFLWFASELKSIVAAQDRRPMLNPQALGPYFALGYVPAPLSIFSGIEKLLPGTMLEIDLPSRRETTHRYWHPAAVDRRPPTDPVAQIRSQLESAVHQQMVSDVPLGAFLSGGIDSSAVVAMMALHSDRPVKTYSIGFDAEGAGAQYNELKYARRVADLFGTDHQEIIVRPDVISLLPRLLWHLDEPVADSAFITTHLVSELASRDVTVILSGVGGDELFGGYRRYLGAYFDRWMNRLPKSFVDHVLMPIAERLPSDRHSPALNLARLAKRFILSSRLDEHARYREYVGVFTDPMIESLLVDPVSPGNTILEAFEAATSSDGVDRLMEVDLLTQLPDDLLALTDRMTMASSIECRVPLLDQSLVDLALTIPGDMKIKGRDLKHLLKLALKEDLPRDILYRSKRGFGAPMGAWLKESLSPLVDALLSPATVERRGLFHYPAIRRLIEDHRSNREDHSDHLQALVNLEIFSQVYLDGVQPSDVSEQLEELAAA